jgi:peptide/nickel transport system substrate-binding protein
MIFNRSMNNHSLFYLIALLAVAVLATACGAPATGPEVSIDPSAAPVDTDRAEASPTIEVASSERGAGDTLRLLYWQAPTIVNPHLSVGTKDLSASRIAYEPLASFNAEGRLIPFLAAEIPSLENGGVAPDGRSVTWKLKQDVKWSDGEPFTADDVLFTYEYITNPEVRATSVATYDVVESVEVIDDHTVRVNFEDTNPAWSLPFVGVQGMIIPRHIFEGYAGPNALDAPANLVPVGTGPYRGVEFKTEDLLIIGDDAVSTIKIIYEPNPFFREADKPFFSRVELQGGGGDAVVAAQAVQDGLVDFAWNVQVGDETVAQMESTGQGKALFLFGAWVERIMINFTDPNQETADGERSSVEYPHPFFSDKAVRQALAYAIERDAIVELYGRGGRPTSNLLVSPTSYESPNTAAEFNLEKAAALLDETGWTDTDGDGIRDKKGRKLSIVFQTSINPVRQQTQEIVKEALESIGVEVELKNIDSSIFFGPVEDNTGTRRHFYADLEEFAYSNKGPDPDAYMKAWTCDEIAQKANDWSLANWGRYCNPAYDALYQQSTTEMDPERRRQLFIQMNDMLIEDVALVPLVHLGDITGINNTLDGLDLTPWDLEVWNIKDWRRQP